MTVDCSRCGTPCIPISGRLLAIAIGTVRPSLKSPSLPASILTGKLPSARRSYLICLECDAYGLGAEFERSFLEPPITDAI